MVIAELAIIASVFGPGKGIGFETMGVPVDIRAIQKRKKGIEGRTQMKTAATTVADVGDTEPFLVERIGQILLRHRLLLNQVSAEIAPLKTKDLLFWSGVFVHHNIEGIPALTRRTRPEESAQRTKARSLIVHDPRR
ncbi:hypothetical protein LptCag_1012 [Leptospirillum ferriphilum]|uniref:Uncharacterized protein n=1 Tax=Leptospirillum ferriphilum TaxID=178606 RepID=A0A094X6Q7_9BACT|nr:hypothetical protein LptCag_1012 [Leptospirillum ferriphilum]